MSYYKNKYIDNGVKEMEEKFLIHLSANIGKNQIQGQWPSDDLTE